MSLALIGQQWIVDKKTIIHLDLEFDGFSGVDARSFDIPRGIYSNVSVAWYSDLNLEFTGKTWMSLQLSDTDYDIFSGLPYPIDLPLIMPQAPEVVAMESQPPICFGNSLVIAAEWNVDGPASDYPYAWFLRISADLTLVDAFAEIG